MTEPDSSTSTITEEREGPYTVFRIELKDLINKCCMENSSNTPDFILASYLINCLESFDAAVKLRTAWYDTEKIEGFYHPDGDKTLCE